jgi:hypothetical protein
MSSGGSSSQSGSAQKWAKGFAQSAANNVQGVVGQAQPGLNSLTDQVQGSVPGIYGKYQAGDPALNASEAYSTNTLNPSFLSGQNPNLENIIAHSNADVRDQVGASYGSRGAFGGTPWETGLAKGISGNEDNLRYQDYQSRMQQQQQAAQGAPQQATAGYIGITPFLAAAQAGAGLPYTGINAQSTDLSQLFNGTTQKTSGNLLGSVLGGLGAVGAGVASNPSNSISDPRLKENIEKVGEMSDGLGIYRWNYIWGPQRFEGVMADEVKQLRPWALGPEILGHMTVNYRAL